jgi:hypothetical protein
VAVLAASIFVLVHHSYEVERFPLPAGFPPAQLIRLAVGNVGSVTQQLIAAYGAPNFGSPLLVQLVWGGSAMLLVGVALLLLRGRDAALLAGGLVLVLVALPFAVDLSGAHTRGLVWQGRYELPLAVGLPLLAASLLSQRRPDSGRAHVLGPLVVGLCLLVSYFWVVRRHQLGLEGPLNPFPSGPGVWQPPLPNVLLFLLAAGLSAAYAGLVYRSSRPQPTPAHPPDTAEPALAGATTGSPIA